MKKFKINVVGERNRGGSSSFFIEVSINDSNYSRYGGFQSWIMNSSNKADVSAWLATQCSGYDTYRFGGCNEIK